MYEPYQKFSYDGPVLYFGTLVADHWKGETMASSEKKAKSNLKYQVKKQMNLVVGTKVDLPGKVKMVN